MHKRARLLIAVVLLLLPCFSLVGCSSTSTSIDSDSSAIAPFTLRPDWSSSPLYTKPHAGIKLRDDAELGLPLVSWLYPGPLEGTGFSSPHLKRGDTVLTVNGKKLSADEFNALIYSSKPGDEVVLRVKRTGGDKLTSVPQAVIEDGPEETVKFTLGRKSDWEGPVAFPSVEREANGLLPDVTKPSKLAEQVKAFTDVHELTEPMQRVASYLKSEQLAEGGFHALSAVNFAFHHPMHIVDLQTAITRPLDRLPRDPKLVLTHGAQLADVTPPQLPTQVIALDDEQLFEHVITSQRSALAKVLEAFAELGDSWQTQYPAALRTFMSESGDEGVASGHLDPQQSVIAMQLSMKVDFAKLYEGAAAFSPWFSKFEKDAKHSFGDARETTETERAAGVLKGTVVASREIDGRWFVIGGEGDNEYDMSRIDVLIDLGGDDVYRYPDNATALRSRARLIVDLSGDDKHEADFAGAAGALLGVSVIVDHEGDDEYHSADFGCGAGIMGIGLLVDHGGNDRYVGSTYSQGVGYYGLGAIVDLGGGSDVYEAETYSQGVGGPRGVGLIVDQTGNEVYRAMHPTDSAYKVPATYFSMSQGIGIGARGFDTGGIGVIHDMNGADNYFAGEFSQGGAYFWGLGILHDKRGNDFYSANRYSQGFGCHQAIGVLADDHGNDTYHGRVAVNQGGAWDVSMGVLIDRAGNDTYKGGSISQGGAAQQAIGMLLDLAGEDHYTASAQGTSTGNKYHFEESGGVRSFSLLFDAGGQHDHYSGGHANNTQAATDKANENAPENARMHGLIIDVAESVVLD